MAKWLQSRFKKLDRSKSSLDQNLDQAEIETRTCPVCGFDEIKPDHKYCAMCGTDVKEDERKAPTKGQ